MFSSSSENFNDSNHSTAKTSIFENDIASTGQFEQEIAKK